MNKKPVLFLLLLLPEMQWLKSKYTRIFCVTYAVLAKCTEKKANIWRFTTTKSVPKIYNKFQISSQDLESKRKQSSGTSSTRIDKEPGLLLLLLLSKKQWLLTKTNSTFLCDLWFALGQMMQTDTSNVGQFLKIQSQQSNRTYQSATPCPFGWLFHVLLLAHLSSPASNVPLDCQQSSIVAFEFQEGFRQILRFQSTP